MVRCSSNYYQYHFQVVTQDYQYVINCDSIIVRFYCTVFYFCGHFYRAYKEEVNVTGATLIENHKKKEAIAYCAIYREYLLEKFCSFDTLSDDFF